MALCLVYVCVCAFVVLVVFSVIDSNESIFFVVASFWLFVVFLQATRSGSAKDAGERKSFA